MNKDQRLHALLLRGYFPDELPPPFSTTRFATYRKAIGIAWSSLPNDYPSSAPENFSIPRAKGMRRNLSIVNPVAEYHVAKIVADDWVEIRKHLRSCDYGPVPLDIFQQNDRAISGPDWALVSLRQAEISASYDHILFADISRFYGTLYTHAIPWALNGKSWSKKNLHAPIFKTSVGNRLDVAVRKGNDNQTLGIPVGPDTSRVIAEIVAVAVDKELRNALNMDHNCVLRNVDDWFIGFDTTGQAEDAIAKIASSLRKYELEIHPEKTHNSHAGNVIDAIWPTTLRNFSFPLFPRGQAKNMEHFFALAFDFSKDHPQQNVLDFAVKKTMSVKVHKENWHAYETYILKCIRANPTTIPAAVQILASYNSLGYPIEKTRISKLIGDMIRKCSPTGHHSEVAWALFLAKALRINLKAKTLAPVTEMENSVCALITLDLRSRKQIEGVIDTSLWQQSMTNDGLKSSNWLLAYEAAVKGWLPTPNPSYIESNDWFSVLNKYGVHFYDENKNVKHIKSRRPKQASPEIEKYLSGSGALSVKMPVGSMINP